MLAETYVTVDAERARWFGADALPTSSAATGSTVNNLDSRLLLPADQRLDRSIEKLLRAAAAERPGADGQAGRARLRAGYNKYLQDIGGANGVRDPPCKGKPWVRPITEKQAYRRFYQLTRWPAADVAMPGIAQAKPPTPSASRSRGRRLPLDTDETAQRAGRAAADQGHRHRTPSPSAATARATSAGCCSATRTSRGSGRSASTRPTLTIPARSTSPAASLFGVPAVLIGHTQDDGLEPHGVDRVPLHAVPADARARVADHVPARRPAGADDEPRRRRARAGRRQGVRDRRLPDRDQTRTLYTAPGIGPVFNELVGIPLPVDDRDRVRAARRQRLQLPRLQPLLRHRTRQDGEGELRDPRAYQGIPWVNTIVADKRGRRAVRGHRRDPERAERARRRAATPRSASRRSQLLGLPVLDGSRSACDWDIDPDAARAGPVRRRARCRG